MKIKLKLFANLRRHLPGNPIGSAVEMEFPPNSTLEDLVLKLELPRDEVKICFVNGIICELNKTLREGDEVGIFPPIGGG